MVIGVIVLVGLGLILGSFVNALVWRIHQKKTIINDRSQCPNCSHKLSYGDLFPIVSWLWLRGKCRYCGKPISKQYPIVELAMALVFVLSYLWWPGGVHGSGQWVLFISWLLAAVGLLSLLVYDVKWMLLPNKIVYPTLLIAAAGRLTYLAGFQPDKMHGLEQWLLAVAVSSGVFWLLFTISSGRWIGYGDVRLGLIVGTLLADFWKSLLVIVLSSFVGTALALPMIASGRRGWSSKIPYGPFLIIATFITLLFGTNIIDWYKHLSGY